MKPYTRFNFSLLAVALLGLSACNSFEKAPDYASAIAPPFKNIGIETQDFKIDANKESIVHLPKGGSITVPANAFTDADGNVVKGEVVLKYKQMNSAADIITSGIPMVAADEDGKLQQMQSAGMFDIRGTAAGKDIFIAKDKSLQVNMASTVKGDYDLFYLEEEKPQTATVGLIPQAYADGPKAAPKTWWKQLTNKVSAAPTKFEVLDSFKLKYNTIDFAENEALKQVSWKLSDASVSPKSATNQWALNETWDHVSLVQPIYKSRLLASLKNEVELLPDSSGFIQSDDSLIQLLDVTGKLKKQLCKGVVKDRYFEAKAKQHYLLIKTPSGISVYDANGNLINEFKGIKEAKAISEDRLVYLKPASSYEGQFYIVLSDLKGSFKKEISAHIPLNYIVSNEHLYFCMESLVKSKVLLVYDIDKMSVYDRDGRLIAETQTNGRSEYLYHGHFRDREKIIHFNDAKDQTFLWDWTQNKTYLIKDATMIDDIHPEKPELIFTHVGAGETAPNFTYHYNWKTGVRKLLDTYSKGNYIERQEYSKKGNFFIDLKLKTGVVYNKDFEKIYEGTFRSCQYDEEENVCLIDSKKRTYLLDSKGKILKDFTEYDSTGKKIFIHDHKIIYFSISGIYRYWDLKGNNLQIYNTGVKGIPYLENDSLIGILTDDNTTCIYDKRQKKLTHILNDHAANFAYSLKNNTIFLEHWMHHGASSLWKPTHETLKAGEYQLCVSNKDKMFCTYVYLGPKDLKQIEAYQALQQKSKKQEEERKEEEAAVLRSFEINKFGIYNWDVFYHNEKEYVEMALELGADSLINGHTQFTAFMVTGKNQNVVVKFTREQLSAFKFWPSETTQLLVVLPNGKVGLLDTQVFADLPIEQIKKDKKAKLQLKIYEGMESKKVLDEILKKPAV